MKTKLIQLLVIIAILTSIIAYNSLQKKTSLIQQQLSGEGININNTFIVQDNTSYEIVRNFETSEIPIKAELVYEFLETQPLEPWEIYAFQELIGLETYEQPYSLTLEPDTYVSHCSRAVSVKLWGVLQSPVSQIELRDYPNGIWQATCEEHGAITVYTERSIGLLQILPSSANDAGCEANWQTTYQTQLACGIKIKERMKQIQISAGNLNATGFEAWAAWNMIKHNYI